MDSLAELPLVAALAGLALVDGLSIGTLLIPVFLMLVPGRVRAGRILLYLAAISIFYFAVGVLFTFGLVNLIAVGHGFIESTPGRVVMLVAGLLMLAVALFAPYRRRERGVEPEPGRLSGWRDRLLAEDTGRGAVVTVALGAGVIEVATMLPYLAGMTLLAGADLTMPTRIGALAGYCAVMIAPALLLLALRIVAARAIERPLQRFGGWLQRTGRENTLWVIGIVGFYLARGGAVGLGIIG